MTDVFSQYVTLLDEIEQIPIMARQSRLLTPAQRTEVIAGVVELVRDRVLPQSDRDCAGREALLDDGGGVLSTPAVADVKLGAADHDAILGPLDELARANPADGAQVQILLYRVHAAISGRFSKAELMLASIGEDEQLMTRAPRITGERFARREYAGASRWFG
ncbi:MAG TPA: hypothetical protein VME22_16800 [Solirubrobacteraceae bacterium]|nr:hypothetical protein [Solirubrobacteraceae bacterium]